MKLVVQTSVEIQPPFNLTVRCNVPLKQQETNLSVSGVITAGEDIFPHNPNTCQYRLISPQFIPEITLIIKPWSDQPITACQRQS